MRTTAVQPLLSEREIAAGVASQMKSYARNLGFAELDERELSQLVRKVVDRVGYFGGIVSRDAQIQKVVSILNDEVPIIKTMRSIRAMDSSIQAITLQ